MNPRVLTIEDNPERIAEVAMLVSLVAGLPPLLGIQVMLGRQKGAWFSIKSNFGAHLVEVNCPLEHFLRPQNLRSYLAHVLKSFLKERNKKNYSPATRPTNNLKHCRGVSTPTYLSVGDELNLRCLFTEANANCACFGTLLEITSFCTSKIIRFTCFRAFGIRRQYQVGRLRCL